MLKSVIFFSLSIESGYLPDVFRYWNDWPNYTTSQFKRYGRTWGGKLPNIGGVPGGYVYINQVQNIKDVLLDNFESYEKGDIWQNVLGEVLGTGIFAVDGEAWKFHRKLMSHMFSRKLLRKSAEVTKKKLQQVVKLFEEKAEEIDSFEIDIQDIFFRITFDVTSEVTFGMEDVDSIANEQQDFQKAFDEISSLCQQRFTDPLSSLKRSLNITRREKRIKELKCILDEYAYNVIVNRTIEDDHMHPHESWKQKSDILTLYLQHAKENSLDLSDSLLRDVLLNIMLAGRDTTACALSWAWYELLRNPIVIEKIVSEVKSICGVGEDADFSYNSMQKLRYTHCVVLEVLRLHPPVTNDPRYAKKDIVLPDGTFLPKGIGIDMCFFAMGRDESIWGQDALKFRPERFLDEKEPSAFKFPVFSAGPRMCLGRPMAIMNMKLAMSVLLTSGFNFEDRNGHSGLYKWSLVQSMKDGFPVVITRN